MRAIIASASFAALLIGSAAEAGPWCASYTFGGGMNCGFFNVQQCRSTVAGVGGSCIRNPAEPNEAMPPRNRATREEPRKARQAAPRPEPAKPVVSAPSPAPVAVTPPSAPAPQQVSAGAASAGAKSAGGFSGARKLVVEGKYEAGLAALKSLDFDEHPDIAAYTGLAHSKLGRQAEARVWYEKALASHPNHLPALSYYGMLLVEQGDLPKAQAGLEKIKQICGNTGCYEYAALQAVIAARRQ